MSNLRDSVEAGRDYRRRRARKLRRIFVIAAVLVCALLVLATYLGLYDALPQ
ncbi:MAG: hypothetical protein OXC14_15420 [Rhodospirillaceae bacterium]|nr:hypothetical protein [Rhodospirillaceae bacterium]